MESPLRLQGFSIALPKRGVRPAYGGGFYDAAGNVVTLDFDPGRTDVNEAGSHTPYTTNNLNQYTAADGTSFSYDYSGNMTADGHYYYAYDRENRLTQVTRPDPPTQNLNSFSAYTKSNPYPWVADPYGFAKSGSISDDQESWMSINVSGPGTVQFQWKVSSQTGDYLEFTTDGTYRDSIAREVDWQQKSFTLTGSGSHQLKWRYVKDSEGSAGDDCGWVKDVTFTPNPLTPADELRQALDSLLPFTTGGNAVWAPEGNCAKSGTISDSQESWLRTTVNGPGTITFRWTVSSEAGADELEFWIGSERQDAISGEMNGQWEERSFTVTGSGPHTLQWRYVKDFSISQGLDAGWVDQVEWTGAWLNDPPTTAWLQTLTYVYDPAGRRIAKLYDGQPVLRYIYDGDHCIAEYDGYSHLRRKYVYGPGVDQPICLIEATATYAGTYYYHFDGLGSVVALTNASGNTVQVYDYSVYGQVGALDASHPNRLMFTAREFDKETGLYYYRARYYKPEIGRFLQADPIGYGDGMNFYRYCGNNPVGMVDPSGRTSEVSLEYDPCDTEYVEYTGNYDIRSDTLQPGGHKLNERIEKGAKTIKWVLKVGGIPITLLLPEAEALHAAREFRARIPGTPYLFRPA